jgi:hypothetical protein
MKKLMFAIAAVFAAQGAMIPAASAAGSASFNVTSTLNSACTVGAIADLAFGNYTAFTAGPTGSTSALITCTRDLAGVTAVFDTGADKTATAAGDTPGAAGVMSGAGAVTSLQYTLTTSKGAVSGGAIATTGSIGGGDTYTLTINGKITDNQAGACTGASCSVSQSRTLTMNY